MYSVLKNPSPGCQYILEKLLTLYPSTLRFKSHFLPLPSLVNREKKIITPSITFFFTLVIQRILSNYTVSARLTMRKSDASKKTPATEHFHRNFSKTGCQEIQITVDKGWTGPTTIHTSRGEQYIK